MLDGYHLRKAVFKAAGADEDNRQELFAAIANGQRSEMNRLLVSLREEAKQESREKSIMDAQKYLNRQWDGIVAKRKLGHY